MGRKKIIIKESQAEIIKEYEVKRKLIDSIKKELDSNYEPISAFYRSNKEYYNAPMIKNKIDGDNIPPHDLMMYFSKKFPNLSPEFIKQVITDWYNGDLDEKEKLTANVKVRNKG